MPSRNVSDRLADALRERWQINVAGGWIARRSRLRIVHYLMLARLGWRGRAKGRTFWGAPLCINAQDKCALALITFGYEEAALTSLMLATLRPGMRFVDVGAHVGFQSMLGAELVGTSGRVVSFEPQRQIFDYVERNLKPYPQIRLTAAAVGDSTGFVTFYQHDMALSAFSGSALSGGHQNPSGRQHIVPVVTLDEALRAAERPVDFVKCDVEGAEMSVLIGAGNILNADRPLLVLEAEMPLKGQSRPRVRKFQELLQPFGYQPLAFEYSGAVLQFGPLDRIEMHHANVAFVHPARAEFSFLLSK
jgi:FkbM family methyltransferase